MNWLTKSKFWHSLQPKKNPSKRATRASSKHLALDINSNTCCLLKLEGNFPNYTIIEANIVLTPDNAVKEGHLIGLPALQSTLQKLLSKPIKKRNACCSVPSSLVMHKQINISNNMSAQQIKDKAQHEAKKIFSETTDALYIDHKTDGNESKQLTLIATYKADIDPYIDILKKLKLNLTVVDVDYYTLSRAYTLLSTHLKKITPANHVALFYMTAEYIVMTIHKDNELIYTHHHAIHNDSLQTYITSILKNEEVPSPSNDVINDVIKNISHLLQFFFSEFTNNKIAHIILSGPLALLPNINSKISSTLKINTSTINPLKSMKNQSDFDTETLMKLGPIFTIALGLAMRG